MKKKVVEVGAKEAFNCNSIQETRIVPIHIARFKDANEIVVGRGKRIVFTEETFGVKSVAEEFDMTELIGMYSKKELKENQGKDEIKLSKEIKPERRNLNKSVNSGYGNFECGMIKPTPQFQIKQDFSVDENVGVASCMNSMNRRKLYPEWQSFLESYISKVVG